MMEISELKIKLIDELKLEFENPMISPFAFDWEKGVDLLFEVVRCAGGFEPFKEALEKLLNSTDFNALSGFMTYLERYLTFVGRFIGEIQSEEELTLLPILKRLKLHSKSYPKLSRTELPKYIDKPECLSHFCRAYCTRNEVDHCKKDSQSLLPPWANRRVEFVQNASSVLVVMVYATLKHYDALRQTIENQKIKHPDVNSYLVDLIDDFKRWERIFVSIRGAEKIELYAREEFDEQDRRLREDTIDHLRREFPRLMISGDAGMGKTTTLQYLAYEDALRCQKEAEQNLPFYLDLKSLATGNLTLISKIFDELRRFPVEFVETRLQKGKINLFLDGLNELGAQVGSVEKQIQDLIERYPDVPLLLSSRNSHRFNISKTERMPVFGLNKMRTHQIEDFLSKMALPAANEVIRAEMAVDEVFADWLRVPMLLKMIIEVVEDRQKNPEYQDDPIPENTNELKDSFIDRLYQREGERDSRFSKITFDALTTHFATRLFEKKKSNTAITRDETIRILTEKVKSGFPNADLDYFLRVSTEIGILMVHKNTYSFTNEQYLDFYRAKGMPDDEEDEFDFT
ncbi:MAG: NACHT domain-containing protein [Thiomargarita sp.]|nr:NACHT domain-containing protein [Thiomargarita sp.]